VVLRYRTYLEARHLASGTINLRLGAGAPTAYERQTVLSLDLAAGIRRVKGVKKLGVRLGNWLTAEQGAALWQAPDNQRMKGRRDRALLALLLACGLRRHEAVNLTLDHLQKREEHWAIVDLLGKGGHIRAAPIPVFLCSSCRSRQRERNANRSEPHRTTCRRGDFQSLCMKLRLNTCLSIAQGLIIPLWTGGGTPRLRQQSSCTLSEQ